LETPDLIAGLTIVALLVPEGMAYAQIAGVPPQTAFYAAPIGLLAFAIFGTSRQLVVAVSAVTSIRPRRRRWKTWTRTWNDEASTCGSHVPMDRCANSWRRRD
jgi:hypothetical protein